MTTNTNAALISHLQALGDRAYCDYIAKMKTNECLGWEEKVRTKKFGQAELTAHTKAGELLGKHRAFAEAVAALTTAAAVPAEGVVMVPVELANRVQESLGEFLMDHGWSQRDMDTSDEFGAVLLAADPKAEPVPAGEYPPLPTGSAWCGDDDVRDFGAGPGESALMFEPTQTQHVPLFTAGQMRAYVDADRAMRAQLTPPAVVEPMTDGLLQQHNRDSQELRRLCAARDQARSERDVLKAEIAGLEASCSTLGRLVDELRPDAGRLEWVLRRCAGSWLRSYLGVVSDTSDMDTLRTLIDANRGALAAHGIGIKKENGNGLKT